MCKAYLKFDTVHLQSLTLGILLMAPIYEYMTLYMQTAFTFKKEKLDFKHCEHCEFNIK